ncbi:DNA cytosine methyltransferase [Clostridium sp. KNHs214]|uniref:DNA cytosine methyltransferase n=1 Tax=Clostridium sp. KNHs214 TaxID=1540257 RepID=UPI00068A9B8D|nr:DNA cytosine methyltransferase [Clostridium sp. KNHs214]
MKVYKLLDLFCGAGGLSLGFERNGFEVVQAIDFSKHAIETYNHNRKEKVGIVKDIKEIDEDYVKKYGEIDGIIGGPPCQGFSTAGQRIIDDERNELYREYFKILEWVHPKFFLIENVTGILNFAKGLVKDDIIKRANNLGYEVFYDTLNAVDYGIPQNRKRVFFLGIRKEYCNKDFEFPVGNLPIVSIEDAISDLPSLDKGEDNTVYSKEPLTEYQKYIRNGATTLNNHLQSAHTEDTKKTIALVPEGGSLRDIPEELRGGRKYLALLRRMDRSKPSYTIDTGHRTYFHYEELRVPSVREAARLQSFKDDYVFTGPKQEQYKQVGNAVPPILAEVLANRIKDYLNNITGGNNDE